VRRLSVYLVYVHTAGLVSAGCLEPVYVFNL
jgi:hypothetical protein